jgi:hypothetical protein
VLLALVVPVLVAVPGVADGAPTRHTGGARVGVRPAAGSSQTHFLVSFRAPERTGRYVGSDRRYSVAASGPPRNGCDSSPAANAAPARKGQLVHVALVPQGEGWCPGVYHGAVDELATPVCAPRAICPLYVLVLRRIGSFSFRVG